MTNTQDIALEFIGNHKRNNIEDWLPTIHNTEQKLDAVFGNMIAGVYGDISVIDSGCYEIEISKHEHHLGHTDKFYFETTTGEMI